MTGSIAIDVAIGLIVVYLLYSLLVTIVGELLSSSLAIRSRLLRYAIERMFNDQSPTLAQSVWLMEGKNFQSSLAKRFYEQPSVKYLSKRDKAGLFGISVGKPSYLSPQNFADTMIHLFRAKGEGTTDREMIQYCLQYNTAHIETETLSHLNNLFLDSNGDVGVFREKLKQWFNETMDRTTGWYKRKLQGLSLLIAFILAVSFNVDTIEITKRLATDSAVRDQMVQIGIQASDPNSPIAKAITQAKDSVTADSLLLKSYNDLNKATREASSILGLGWDFSRLSRDTVIKVFADSTAAKKYKVSVDSVIAERKQLAALINRLDGFAVPSRSYTDSLYNAYKQKTSAFSDWAKTSQLMMLGVDTCLFINSKKALGLVVYADSSLGGKVLYVISYVFSHKMKLIGLLITTLMLSLGAPFWFDILKKIVAIRGSGANPEEKKPGGTTPVTPAAGAVVVPPASSSSPPSPQVSDLHLAVDQAEQKLKGIHGIIRVTGGFIRKDNQKRAAVEVQGEETALENARKILGDSINGTPVIYLRNERGQSHQCEPGSTVSNVAGLNGLGTLGLYCRKGTLPNAYIVSCWHVLKANSKWHELTAHENRDVVDGSKKTIAKLVDGAIAPKIDVGFAELKETAHNNHLKLKGDWRPVTSKDSLEETAVSFCGANSGVLNAVIYKHTVPVKLDYPGGALKFEDVFSITVFDENGDRSAPSKKGDSGAAVVDANGIPLGLVIGGDGLYTYVAKFSNILSPSSSFNEYKIIL